jgi:hypothetical protein
LKRGFRRKIVILTVLAVSLLLFGGVLGNASAAYVGADVRVVAPTVVDLDVTNTFIVSIWAENVNSSQGTPPGCFGWEFQLSWTAGVVNCTTETLNLALWGTGNYLGPWVVTPINNVAGTYHQSLTGRAPGVPVTGNFWLANLTFLVLQGGGGIFQVSQTDLNVAAFPPSTYILADKQATQIPHAFIQAHVDFVPEFVQAIPLLIIMLASVASMILARTWKKTK